MANINKEQDHKDRLLIKNHKEILEKFKEQTLRECTSRDGKIDTKKYNKLVWEFESVLSERLEEARDRQRERFQAQRRRKKPKKENEVPLTEEELRRLQIGKDVEKYGVMHYKVALINGKYMKHYPIYEINGGEPVYIPMTLPEILEFKRSAKDELRDGNSGIVKARNVVVCSLAGALLASSIFGGVMLHKQNDEEKMIVDGTLSGAIGVTQVSELTDEEISERLGNFMPEIRSYTNPNGEFLRLDNMVDINYWAYKEVQRELKAYQAQHPDTHYQADLGLLNGAIICGIQMREASGGVNCNTSNPNYQGPFSLPTDKEAMEEINFVAEMLSGEEIVNVSNLKREIQDPRLAAKACIYSLIENHRLLRYALDKAGLSEVEINTRMWLDSYLNGAQGVVDMMVKHPEFYKEGRPYSARILEYSDVFLNYAGILEENPEIRNMDSSAPGRNAHLKLKEITDEYANIDTDQRGDSGSEMD